MVEQLGPYALGRVHQADCLGAMRELPDGCVQSCITSPPYWGLRKYDVPDTVFGGEADCAHEWGTEVLRGGSKGGQGQSGQLADRAAAQGTRERSSDSLGAFCHLCGAWRGQLGLEPTPDLYVKHMVGIFCEARRVLRDDGVLFVNIGDSYAGGGCGARDPVRWPKQSRNDHMPKHAKRAFLRGAPWRGTGGTAQAGSSDPGSACSCLCDECTAELSRHTSHIGRPEDGASEPFGTTARDTSTQGSEQASCAGAPRAVQASTIPGSSSPPPGACSHCATCGACLEVLRSSSPYALACARTGWRLGTHGTSHHGRGSNIGGTDASGLAWGDSTTAALNVNAKPKDLIGIPWLLAFALRADGWYLRAEIIWHKTAPMPESVRDRPTRAHEQVFLLSKSGTYFYNETEAREAGSDESAARAMRADLRLKDGYSEAHFGNPPVRGRPRRAMLVGRDRESQQGFSERWKGGPSRNWRTVWTIGPEPNNAQHYAPFPRELARRCIVAGSRAGDVVLDPFAGTGTTVRVADGLGRKALGFDLGEKYVEQANEKSGEVSPSDAKQGQQAGLFATVRP